MLHPVLAARTLSSRTIADGVVTVIWYAPSLAVGSWRRSRLRARRMAVPEGAVSGSHAALNRYGLFWSPPGRWQRIVNASASVERGVTGMLSRWGPLATVHTGETLSSSSE